MINLHIISKSFMIIMTITIAIIFTFVCVQSQPDLLPDQSGATVGSRSEGRGAPGGPSDMSGGRSGGPGSNSKKITAAILINDGVYEVNENTEEAIVKGKVGKSSSKSLKITSKDKGLTAIYVKGFKSQYTLSNSTIDLYGRGGDMMTGGGAAAVAGAGGTLILKNVKITTNGASSCTTVSTDNSILKVYDSILIANGGVTPNAKPGVLGITGNVRATMTGNNSESYFYNSTIVSDGWGTLSTDDVLGYVYVEANNCDVQTLNSGYGFYADVGATVITNDCKFTNATYTGILAGTGSARLNNINATSGGNCAMIHNVMGNHLEVATLKINGGKIATEQTVILVKSANADITIDGVELKPKNGVLIQSKINEDANATQIGDNEVVGIKAVFKNNEYTGDIIHADTERTMKISLIGATLTGKIKDASLALIANSKWTAMEDSSVTLVDGNYIDKIDAYAGVTITAVPGLGCSLKEGTHKLPSGGHLIIKAG